MNEKEFKQLSEQVKDKKNQLNKNEGKLEALFEELKDKHNIDTLEDAEKELLHLQDIIAEMDLQIKAELDNLNNLLDKK